MTTLKILHTDGCETVVEYPVFFYQRMKNQMHGSGKVDPATGNGIYPIRRGEQAYLINDKGNTIGRYAYVDHSTNK